MAAAPRSLADRLWERVDRSAGDDACWPYTGFIGQNRGTGRGYGQIRDEPDGSGKDGRKLKAHRVALILSTEGGDRPGYDACHRCDNTICCNPKHLFWGTHRENMQDYIVKYGRLAVEKRPPVPKARPPLCDRLDQILAEEYAEAS